jgi:hypothetical protein
MFAFHWPAFFGPYMFGFFGADFFFMLSGFVIAYAYERRLLEGMALTRFCAVRLIRLYPMILAGIALGAPHGAMRNFFLPAEAAPHSITVLAIAANLLMIPVNLRQFGLPGMYPLDVALWSLFLRIACQSDLCGFHSALVPDDTRAGGRGRISVPLLYGHSPRPGAGRGTQPWRHAYRHGRWTDPHCLCLFRWRYTFPLAPEQRLASQHKSAASRSCGNTIRVVLGRRHNVPGAPADCRDSASVSCDHPAGCKPCSRGTDVRLLCYCGQALLPILCPSHIRDDHDDGFPEMAAYF